MREKKDFYFCYICGEEVAAEYRKKYANACEDCNKNLTLVKRFLELPNSKKSVIFNQDAKRVIKRLVAFQAFKQKCNPKEITALLKNFDSDNVALELIEIAKKLYLSKLKK